MRDAPDWSRWGTFDRWLLRKEKDGQSVKTFCEWFVSDAFRVKQLGMWTPSGTKENKYSFKRSYPQAFENVEPPAESPDLEAQRERARLFVQKRLEANHANV